jgi:hypothetical protein
MRSDIVPGGAFPDYELPDHTRTGLVIHRIYNGYWFWGRPSIDDLWQDLRLVTSAIRPDWDLGAPRLREAWKMGDLSPFHGWNKQSDPKVLPAGRKKET